MKEKFLLLDQALISTDVFRESFSCDLSACKGACCWRGDYGAPLTASEAEAIEQHAEVLAPELTEASRQTLRSNESVTYYSEMKQLGTQLNPDGSCVFMVWQDGIAQCKIEQYQRDNPQAPKKPVSCELYPIRTSSNHQNALEIVEYDRWDICSAACSKGAKEKMPVFRFVKSGLIRKYGEAFYEQLESIFEDSKSAPE